MALPELDAAKDAGGGDSATSPPAGPGNASGLPPRFVPKGDGILAIGSGGPYALAAARATAEEALLDYLETFYNLRRAGSALRKMGAIDFVTTIAPGLRDVLLTGKAVEVVRRRDKNAHDKYDAVVLDAPPTGRIAKFLNAADPAEVLFTRGTTESINLVARSWGHAHLKAGDIVLTTEFEHHSNLVPWQQVAKIGRAHV